MQLVLTEESWILEELNPIEWRFLSQLPAIAAGEEVSEECLRRLKPNPLDRSDRGSAEDSEFIEDWSEFVQPDLDQLFDDARSCVAKDLDAASKKIEIESGEMEAAVDWPTRIEVPDDHSEQWYSAINQARLLMNEAHGLGEASERFESDSFEESEEGVENFLLLAQYEFYTAIQSILIEYRMDP